MGGGGRSGSEGETHGWFVGRKLVARWLNKTCLSAGNGSVGGAGVVSVVTMAGNDGAGGGGSLPSASGSSISSLDSVGSNGGAVGVGSDVGVDDALRTEVLVARGYRWELVVASGLAARARGALST